MSNDSEATKTGLAAGAGTVGAIGAAAAGTSAATMTGTLATIGATVDGGMAAGIGIVAAAPLAVGGIAYGLYKWLKD
ncbi:hypothetical protein FACS189441_6130 [Betaproteobacteria bacterium]|nr:hypothetical protein FACS189441_6130 [Betaproteobacteria bacterium]